MLSYPDSFSTRLTSVSLVTSVHPLIPATANTAIRALTRALRILFLMGMPFVESEPIRARN
jgi:hypothetical protein